MTNTYVLYNYYVL